MILFIFTGFFKKCNSKKTSIGDEKVGTNGEYVYSFLWLLDMIL